MLSLTPHKNCCEHPECATFETIPPSHSETVEPVQLTQVLNFFPFTGYCFTKPELIFTLEQGEDPWLLKKEFLRKSSPGELLNTGRRHPRKLDLKR